MNPPKVYLIGSLRNAAIPVLGARLRRLGFEVFDDWHGSGPEADDYWQKYEQTRGRPYSQALYGYAATTIFEFDQTHLDDCDIAVLIAPAGKSGHMELGYVAGHGKRTYVFMEGEPERWDVMYRMATKVCFSYRELISELQLARAEMDDPN